MKALKIALLVMVALVPVILLGLIAFAAVGVVTFGASFGVCCFVWVLLSIIPVFLIESVQRAQESLDDMLADRW